MDENKNKNQNEGWICPKCGKVNAPWVVSCSCSNVEYYPNPYYPFPHRYPHSHPYDPRTTWWW